MEKQFRVRVFGKADCDKCRTLNQRLDKLLSKPEWEVFEKEYCDVLSVDGLVAFAEAECVNPQRIPALLVLRRDDRSGTFEPLPNPDPGAPDPICGATKLYHLLGLQTDYSDAGRGVITPKMLTAVLSDALKSGGSVTAAECAQEAESAVASA